MDVSAEAKRIMVQALSKMYSSRTQRGGLRLHRSLLLTLVMKSAREMYHGARAAEGDKENQGGRGPAASDRRCRKRLGQATSEPDFLPCKKAKMDPEGLRRAAPPPLTATSANCCRPAESLVRAAAGRTVVTF